MCFNVNFGSADVTHTLVFFSRLSLSESIHMSVFVLSFDNQWELLHFWSGGADMLTWGRRNYLGCKTSRYQSATCALKFGAGLTSWVWYF